MANSKQQKRTTKRLRRGNPMLVKGGPSLNPHGRPKGSKNKFTRDMKEAILNAFEKLGGEEYLVKQGRSKDSGLRRAIMGLFGRVLPLQLTGDPLAPLATIDLSKMSSQQLKALVAAQEAIGIKPPEPGQGGGS